MKQSVILIMVLAVLIMGEGTDAVAQNRKTAHEVSPLPEPREVQEFWGNMIGMVVSGHGYITSEQVERTFGIREKSRRAPNSALPGQRTSAPPQSSIR
jgi:hypothetical protein